MRRKHLCGGDEQNYHFKVLKLIAQNCNYLLPMVFII